MEAKTSIYNLWIQYTTQNDAQYFWQFVSAFVDIWETQSGVDFKSTPLWSEVKPDNVPTIGKLPDELLAAIGKFLYISKERAQKDTEISMQDLKDAILLFRCLFIMCRNFDNIPFIASCDYVSLSAPLVAKYIDKLLKSNRTEDEVREISKVISSFCHFLEGLYDPYLTWRNYLVNEIADFSKLVFKPAVLHVEVVPFIYDCFQSNLIEKHPSLCVELLHVLGATISGAQHNALRSVCPATVCLVIRIISAHRVDRTVRQVALQCFTVMVQVLHKSTPEQRQIELSLILDMYTDGIKKLLAEPPVKSDISFKLEDISDSALGDGQLESKTSGGGDASDKTIVDRDEKAIPDHEERTIVDHEELSFMLCSALETVRKLLEDFEASRSAICQLLVDLNYLNTLVKLPEKIAELKLDTQSLGIECIRTITRLLSYSRIAKSKISAKCEYGKIVGSWIDLCQPSRELLQEFVNMALGGQTEDDIEKSLCNPEVVIVLIRNLHYMEEKDQTWLAQKLSWLCTKNLRSKWVACQKGAILSVCDILSSHDKTVSKAMVTLINLLDNLACTSITAQELKQIILLLRPEKEFSHKIPLLHTLCNITRKGESVCKAFLDVQMDTDGIIVPSINKWTNTSYGFSFHCWICVDKLPESHESYGKPRQLLNLLTQTGQGLEVSIDQSGSLVITVLKKSSSMSSTAPLSLDDNRWHCVSICLGYARRALSHNQISVFVDGAQRLSTSMKFPAFDDVFIHCSIGAPVTQDAKLSTRKTEIEKETFHGTFVRNLFSNPFLPSLVLQAPSYLSFGTMGSKSNQGNPIDTSHSSNNQVPLHGHIAHASLFNDTFTMSAARWLYEAGADCHTILCSEEGPDSQEMFSRLVFCYSALATWDGTCLNLASSGNYNGATSALRVHTTSVKEVINVISNVHAFFPLLEDADVADLDSDLDVFRSAPSPVLEQMEQITDFEGLPSSSYTEWKLDQNPVSMFLTLLKNSILGSPLNQEELLKNDGVVTIGILLCQCKQSLIDVNVLMATQLLCETVRALPNPILLKSIYLNILFNFKIWTRCPFHIRIGHIQYISNLVKQDRPYFRKNFGVQYIFDVIRNYYANSENLSVEDAKTIRIALLGIVKYLISKDLNINELICMLGFLESVKEGTLLIETLEMLITQMEAKNCKDQIFLLLHEKYTGETLYVLLLNRSFGVQFKIILVKFLLVLLRTDRVHSRNKATMQLQDGNLSMYPGLVGFMDPKSFTIELATHLFDLMCIGETRGGYAGILALIHCLTFEDLDMKLELAKKLLAATFVNLNAPFVIAKQVGWQDCIARLLVKRCISDTTFTEEAIDLMTFDEESLRLEPDTSYSHHAHMTSLSEAANVIEHEIKEIAGSVSEAVSDNLHAVSDNLHYAADNLTTAVASVCSVIRQKTVDLQESLGELGHISRSHLPSLNENDSVEFNADSDSVVISNRSVSTSSLDEDQYSIDRTEHDDPDGSKLLSEKLGDMNMGVKYVDKEENLSYLVSNILFTILWRGVEGFSKESWKERGQVMACINLLALNNELYCSHLELRLHLLEMGVQAALLDLKDTGTSTLSAKSNALHLMRLIYDLVVLDPNKDDNKKCSSKLLDGVLALLDALKVFTDEDADPTRRELARLGLGVLAACAGGSGGGRAALAAPACALLHSLLRAAGPGVTGDPETEAASLMCVVGSAMKQAIEVGNHDQYSFLIPVMKALLEKVHHTMNLEKYLPDLPKTNSGPVFFSDFETFIQSNQWSQFIEYKVRPLSIAYDRETNSLVGEPLNTFWAECYEACKASAQARGREQNSAKGNFQNQVITSFKTWQIEDLQRYNAALSQMRGREAKATASWKTRRDFLRGPRGAWAAREFFGLKEVCKDTSQCIHHLQRYWSPVTE